MIATRSCQGRPLQAGKAARAAATASRRSAAPAAVTRATTLRVSAGLRLSMAPAPARGSPATRSGAVAPSAARASAMAVAKPASIAGSSAERLTYVTLLALIIISRSVCRSEPPSRINQEPPRDRVDTSISNP